MVQHNRFIALVFDSIKVHASEEKPISSADILRKVLADNPSDVCERKTIQRALEQLREMYGPDDKSEWPVDNIRLHYETVQRRTSPIYRNYWLEINEDDDDSFTDEELTFLIDAVQFSRHVSHKYATDIIKKLIALSPNAFSDKFENYKNIDADYHAVKKDFFLNLGNINEASRQHKKVSFYATKYWTDKKLHKVGDSPIVVSPYRIVIADGNYYLLCSVEGSSVINSFRIDRITEVNVLDQKFSYTAETRKLLSNPEEYIMQHRYMYPGTAVEVTLSIYRDFLDEAIDSFGTGISIEAADETSNCLTIHLKSSERDIIDWALRYGEYCEIIKPNYLRNEIGNMTARLHNCYVYENHNEYYERQIAKVEKHHGLLHLTNIDLNKYDSYKHLTNVSWATFRQNRIKDFSFLRSYADKLHYLTIERNKVKDLRVISELSKLKTLTLIYTGTTNLDFLAGHRSLRTLCLHELTVENVEGIYHLPRLRRLIVNRTTAALIDESRLREIYGDNLLYDVEDNISFIYRREYLRRRDGNR
ncbi:MAG: WYL domain-containing protein [Saccharofermentans sp.]|nr:WYL domain-containing protein [Saccharofermentans sp.]